MTIWWWEGAGAAGTWLATGTEQQVRTERGQRFFTGLLPVYEHPEKTKSEIRDANPFKTVTSGNDGAAFVFGNTEQWGLYTNPGN